MTKCGLTPSRRKCSQFPAECSKRDFSMTKTDFARVCFPFLSMHYLCFHWNCRRELEGTLEVLQFTSNQRTLQVFSLSETMLCRVGLSQKIFAFSTCLQGKLTQSLPFSGVILVAVLTLLHCCTPDTALLMQDQKIIVVTNHRSRHIKCWYCPANLTKLYWRKPLLT